MKNFLLKLHDLTSEKSRTEIFYEFLSSLIKKFTFVKYDPTDYTYKIIFTSLDIKINEDVYFLDAEIEQSPPFKIFLDNNEIDVLDKLNFTFDSIKYAILFHEKLSSEIKSKIENITYHYFIANRNYSIVTNYQNKLLINECQLNILNEVGEILGNFNLEVVLSRLLEHAVSIVEGDVGIILLYNEEKEELEGKISWGVREEIIKQIKNEEGTPIVYEVFKNKICFFYDSSTSPFSIDYPSNVLINSLLILPIFTKNRDFGVLALVNFKVDEHFNDFKIKTVETFVKISAIGVENSIFFEESLKQEKIKTQLKIAEEIQKRFLPEKDFETNEIVITGASYPAMTIGGDFYSYFTPTDNRIIAFLGDVAGKGIPAALLTTMSMMVIKTSYTIDKSLSENVTSINDILASEEVGDGYLTLGIFDIDLNEKVISVVNGGHPPIFYFNSQSKKVQLIESENLPVGLFEGVEYIENKFNFKQGDIFLTFSDGITDAKNLKDENYDIKNIKDIVEKNFEKPAKEIKNIILEDVFKFSKGTPQFDDLTLLLLKFN